MRTLSQVAGSLIGMLALILPLHTFAQESSTQEASQNVVTISVFVRDDCKHCIAEKAFLADLAQRRDDVNIVYHNFDDEQVRRDFKIVTKELGLSQGTPVTLVGTTVFSGFDTAETTGSFIENLVDTSRESTTFDAILSGSAPEITVASSLVDAGICSDDPSEGCDTDTFSVRIPIIGTQISLATLSMSTVSLVLGFIDGFNPCALWVLVIFLTLLLRVGSRKRMFQYAGLFILAEAIMYWAILMVWFSAWDFIGLSRIVTPIVGALALGSGVYFLYKFVTWKNVCTVMGIDQQSKLSKRIEKITSRPLTIVTALGIIALALSVNIFEFACSIGIPQAFTKILEINALSGWETQFQMFLYIVMYMIDDVVVFALALWGAGHVSDAMKYSKWTTLLGGVLMFILGVLMIFAPDRLIF